MNRLIALILLMLYTLTSTGMTVYYHQCGETARISLSEKEAVHETCKLCKKKQQHSCHHEEHDEHACSAAQKCCTDVQVDLKNSEEQLASSSAVKDLSAFISPAEFIIPWIITCFLTERSLCGDTEYTYISSTPFRELTDTYLLLQNFRV